MSMPSSRPVTAVLGGCTADAAMTAVAADPDATLVRAEHLARRALAEDATSGHAHVVLAMVGLARGQFDQSRHLARRAADLVPHRPSVVDPAGAVLTVAGDGGGGMSLLREMTKANPRYAGRRHEPDFIDRRDEVLARRWDLAPQARAALLSRLDGLARRPSPGTGRPAIVPRPAQAPDLGGV